MSSQCVSRPLQRPRPGSTFALQMLRDQQKKLELAARMRSLWEDSGVTQEHIADYIGLKHRSYQKALQTGGISYEKLRKLAEFHDVDFDWLVKGEAKRETPDLMSNGNGEPSQLDRIEDMLERITQALELDKASAGARRPLADPPPLPRPKKQSGGASPQRRTPNRERQRKSS